MLGQRSQKEKQSSLVKVIIRVRPFVQSQKLTKQIVYIQPDFKTLKIYNDQINHIQSKFDKVIHQQQTQIQVFKNFQPYIPKIFQGFNLTIFAYGQTGSGKTYTMFGSDWQNFVQRNIQTKKQITHFDSLENDTNFAGIIPRSIFHLFQNFQKFKSKFNLYCSFLQIYNQKIYDLLQDSINPKPLNIHQSKVNGIFVQGLTQFQVQHFADCLNLMRQGQKNRFIRETSMNAKSSRSHTIFQILAQAIISDSQGNYIKARLNLCDLAGSQKINKNQHMVNDHLQELKNINLSLTTLGKVIYALSSGKKTTVAAFRQSKLTRLLQQSLTINTNTFIIGNISPSQKNLDQTINTLKFAQRASHITMKIKPIQFNQQNPDSVLKLKKQIEYLKGLLQNKRKGYNEKELDKNINEIQKGSFGIQNQAISTKEFEKLLYQNRKMKKQISDLQNNLEKINSTSSNSSYRTINSAISSNNNSETQLSRSEYMRKQIYYKNFLKKGQKNEQSSRQETRKGQKNRSILGKAGKATIQQQKHTSKEYAEENKRKNEKKINQKLSILKKYEKIESQKKHNDSMVIAQLENIQNSMKNKKIPFQKQFNHNNIFSPNKNKNQAYLAPKRYHQANVIRRGKMSLQADSLHENYKLNQDNILSKKNKIDYSQKIRELQSKLYHK